MWEVENKLLNVVIYLLWKLIDLFYNHVFLLEPEHIGCKGYLRHIITWSTYYHILLQRFKLFPLLMFLSLRPSWTQAVNYVHWSEVKTETSIVSSGILSPALCLSQHFISSNLLIEPMDYEQQSFISRFLALLPENLQQTPLILLKE